MYERGQRNGLVRVSIGKGPRSERSVITRDMQVIDVLEQVGNEEEGVDLILMFRRFGEMVLLVRPCFKRKRIIF